MYIFRNVLLHAKKAQKDFSSFFSNHEKSESNKKKSIIENDSKEENIKNPFYRGNSVCIYMHAVLFPTFMLRKEKFVVVGTENKYGKFSQCGRI